MAAPYTGSGAATGAVPTGANPYGLDPQTQALLQAMGGLGSSVGSAIPQAPDFQRQAVGAQAVPGQPNNLLLAILQMRAQEAQALGAPYQQGTAPTPERYSLLSG